MSNYFYLQAPKPNLIRIFPKNTLNQPNFIHKSFISVFSFKMSVCKVEDVETNKGASGSKTIDQSVTQPVEAKSNDSVSLSVRTIKTQCGGAYVDEENIVVLKKCLSPQYEIPDIEENLSQEENEYMDEDLSADDKVKYCSTMEIMIRYAFIDK